MKRLHIVFLNRAYYPEVSATGQLLAELAEGLARDYGCKISVVAGLPQGEMPGSRPSPPFRIVWKETSGTVTIFRARGTSFGKKKLAGRICNYLTYFVSACIAVTQLEKPDVVIALTDPPVIGLAALLAGKLFRSKTVISYRDLFPEVTRLVGNSKKPFIEFALNCVNRVLINRSDKIVALGEAMRDRLIREKNASPQKTIIIPDWADSELLSPGPKNNSFSVSHGLEKKFAVMHAGNIGASQNLSVLIQAAAFLRGITQIEFVFVGEGVSKNELQAEAEKRMLTNVRFFPYQPKETLSAVFASADCFIISLKPGLSGYIMPSKLYGILAAGRPYISAVDADCDVAKIAKRFDAGLTARQNDPEDLAEKIRTLYENKEMLERMGRNAASAAASFSRSAGVKAYYDLCRELAVR